MLQPLYSIEDLEGMLDFYSAENIADALKAAGVPLIYNQESADLSGWKRKAPSTADGKLVAVRGKRPYPDPDAVMVASCTLPADWQRLIENAEADQESLADDPRDGADQQAAAPEASRAPKERGELGARERNNLLRVIAVLARKSGISLEPQKDGAKAIEILLDEYGFKQPQAQTIRKFLNAARSLSE